MTRPRSGAVAESAKNLITPHDTRAGGFAVWVCMDDRPIKGVGRIPYFQIGGGVHGASTDLLVMTELVKPGTFLNRDHGQYTKDQSRHTIPDLSKESHLTLIKANILAWLHDYCAGEGSAPDINTNIITNDRAGLLLPRALELFPDLDPNVYERDIALRGVLAAQGVFRGSPAGITRVPLVDMQHVATDIIANHQPGTVFNPYDAIGPDPENPVSPAYNISFGEMPNLFNPLLAEQGIAVDERTMLTVSAVRHAALTLVLPHQPLEIHRVGA